LHHKLVMMFSKACEYGIKAAVFIAVKSQQESRVSLNEIAKEINSPIAFTAKVLQQLRKNGIIDSVKGPNGGFEINKNKVARIKLNTIVSAIDGDSIYIGCGLGFQNCNEDKPCVIHHQFKLVRNDLKQMLETTSLLDLSNDINNGITFLKR